MIAILKLFPRKGEEGPLENTQARWASLCPPQLVCWPKTTAAPFVRAIGASPAGTEKMEEEEPKCGEFGLWIRQIQKIKLCLRRGLCATRGNEPDGSSLPPALFQWGCKMFCTSIMCIISHSRLLHSHHQGSCTNGLLERPVDLYSRSVQEAEWFKCRTKQRVLKTTLGKLNKPRNSPPETTKQGKC